MSSYNTALPSDSHWRKTLKAPVIASPNSPVDHAQLINRITSCGIISLEILETRKGPEQPGQTDKRQLVKYVWNEPPYPVAAIWERILIPSDGIAYMVGAYLDISKTVELAAGYSPSAAATSSLHQSRSQIPMSVPSSNQPGQSNFGYQPYPPSTGTNPQYAYSGYLHPSSIGTNAPPAGSLPSAGQGNPPTTAPTPVNPFGWWSDALNIVSEDWEEKESARIEPEAYDALLKRRIVTTSLEPFLLEVRTMIDDEAEFGGTLLIFRDATHYEVHYKRLRVTETVAGPPEIGIVAVFALDKKGKRMRGKSQRLAILPGSDLAAELKERAVPRSDRSEASTRRTAVGTADSYPSNLTDAVEDLNITDKEVNPDDSVSCVADRKPSTQPSGRRRSGHGTTGRRSYR